MVTYIIRRLLYSVLVLIAASFLVFTFVAKGAGDPLGPLRFAPNVDEAGLDRIAEEKHLNDSVFVRYGYWVRDAVTNNFGETLLTNKPILPDLWRVMKNTLQLVVAAELIAILLAIGIGVLSALRQYSIFDYTATTFSFLGLAMPLFWLALMLQVLVVQVQSWTGHFRSPISMTSTRGAASTS
jgi:peptide/nickel transport system permease protein